jgi:RNA polymerase sigma factor (sigma-70 family)
MTRAELEQRFDALIAAHGASLSRLAGSFTRNAADREDLLQEIAIAIWRALPTFRGECSDRTFLFRIAQNRGISHITRSRLTTTPLSESPEPVARVPDPETALAAGQAGQRLAAAVRQLPLGQREVVMLSLEGLSYREIADVLGITDTNVGARLTRARQMLKSLL